ncbi:TetR/AcrR family transcriptional regulator [Streptomyces chrestomyceticus]|uniref:TetR/AcrR family transcriptional regulator n=1 Tax=Streptomyces chrestomyceticus TaxID=68185 RepID=UPI000F617500|nr:TetR/AcrR family transcriptional regulator [Streptomyces chrestomyceticus]
MSVRTEHRGRHGDGAVRGAAPGAGPEAAAPALGPRRGATRRKLFDAAVTLIAEQGFSATTVDEIADRAGVAKGTVYYNFASKNVLYEELLRDGIDLLSASLRDAADRAVRVDGGTRVDALDAMIRAGLDFIAGSPSLTQLYVAELWRTNRVWQPTLQSVRGRAVAVVEDVLREAVDVGELTEELDIPLTASALLGMVLVAALDWLSFQPHRSVEDVHASLSRLLQGRVSPLRAD